MTIAGLNSLYPPSLLCRLHLQHNELKSVFWRIGREKLLEMCADSQSQCNPQSVSFSTDKRVFLHLTRRVSRFQKPYSRVFKTTLRRKKKQNRFCRTFWTTYSDTPPPLHKRPSLPMPIITKEKKIILAFRTKQGAINSGCREKDRMVPEQAEQSRKHE